MITRSLLVLLALLILLSSISIGQTSKRGSKKRAEPNLALDKPFTTPCGVSYNNFDEAMQESSIEWRVAASSSESVYLYNTRKQQCDRTTGIMKVWIKERAVGSEETASMMRYELKCRSNELRVTSLTEYLKTGDVSRSRTYKTPEWNEVIPDSVGEGILETVCRKTL
jgi:hypothetical protein